MTKILTKNSEFNETEIQLREEIAFWKAFIQGYEERENTDVPTRAVHLLYFAEKRLAIHLGKQVTDDPKKYRH